jgi:penicillin-binding protein 2
MVDHSGSPGSARPSFLPALTFRKTDRKRRPILPSGDRRFVLLTGLVALVLLLILARTGSLQLFGSQEEYVVETVGKMSEISLSAPRGDIVDRNGIPLAVSDTVNRVELVSTRMSNDQLNRFLLDLAVLFDEYRCDFNSPLLRWFDLPQDLRSVNLLETEESLSFVFRQPLEEIEYWQTDKDLFNMVARDKATTESQKRRTVREDPNEFYEYLLDVYFRIEPDRASGSRLYTDGEAFLIMQLRYLLLENNWLFVSGQPVTLANSVPEGLSARLIEQNYKYPGITVTKHYERRYTQESEYVGHALGYIGSISQVEYNRLKTAGYSINDLIGKTGIEQAAEPYLRGVAGTMTLDSWYSGESANPVTFPGEVSVPPVSGNEVKMTIDMNMQKLARQELETKIMEFRGGTHKDRQMEAPGGCVIVLDAKTGAVLVNANYPDYDPADFVYQFEDSEAARRVNDLLTDTEYRPLLNRGISEAYTPGSTFKPVTAMAALEAEVITPYRNQLVCRGVEEIGGFVWRCYGWHGPIDLTRAIVTSCNLYFYQIGVETGIDRISQFAKTLGLGESTGLDISSETAGVRPSRAVKEQLNARPEDQTWFVADTCQTSIGQFYNSYSMLQMARAIAGLATNSLPTPHLIKEIVSPEGEVMVAEQIELVELGLDPLNVISLREAMVGLSKDRGNRTGVLLHDFPVRVACKTGTAESYNEKMEPISNSVFVCYAPADDPEIVIAHAISDGAYGEYSADISYRILCQYFGVEPTHARMGPYDAYRGR